MATTVPERTYHAFELANETLKMLNCSASVLNDEEVNSGFLIKLGVILFGSEIVEYINPVSEVEIMHNLKNLIKQISLIIGMSLKHINADAICRQEMSAIKDLMEIIHAFVAYCVKSNLLDFTASGCNSRHHHEWKDFEEIEVSRMDIPTPPEVPRSAGRSCIHRSSGSHTKTRNKNGAMTGRAETVYIADSAGSNHMSLSGTNVHRWNFSRLHGSHSPPATPQAIDEILELEKHQSPNRSRSSPIFSPFGIESMSTSVAKPMISKYSIDDDCQWNEQTSALSSRHKKTSSSSSGCGHSPNTWSAAVNTRHPLRSSSSTPTAADLLSSNCPYGGVNENNEPASTGDSVVCDLDDNRRFAQHANADDLLHVNVCPDSTPSRSSDKAGEVYSVPEPLRSCHLRDWERPYGSAVSTASILLARTDGFSRALKRRLSHLRTMFSRAQAEADAVSRLVASLTSDRRSVVRSAMDQSERKGIETRQARDGDHLSEDCSAFVTLPCLRDMLQQVLSGVNTLLARRHVAMAEVVPETEMLVRWEMEYLELMQMRDKLMLDALSILEGILKTQPLLSK